jgi:lipopolysaccharide export system protein LptA
MTAILASGRKVNRSEAVEKGALTSFGETLASRQRTFTVVIVALATAAAGVVVAQPKQQPPSPPPKQQQQPSGPPNALQGFSQNRDKPVKINAAELEVHDKDKMAVFSGDVHLVQGDTDMRSSKLVVFYDDQPPPPAPAPKSGKAGGASAQITPQQQNQQIKRVEAKGSVIVTQKDQTATGNEGIFDMRANTVTMVGNVLITQGTSVIKGDKLTVNMTTGDAAVTCDKPPCRVKGIFEAGAMKQGLGGGPPSVPGRKP